MKRSVAVLLAVMLGITGCRNDPSPNQGADSTTRTSAPAASSSSPTPTASRQDCSGLDAFKQQYPEQPEPQGLLVTVEDLRKYLGCVYVADVQKAQTGSAMTVLYITPTGRFTQYINESVDAAKAWAQLHKPPYAGAAPQSQRMEVVGDLSETCNQKVKTGCLGLMGANQQGDPTTYTELYIYNRRHKQFASLGADATKPFTDRIAWSHLIQDAALKR